MAHGLSCSTTASPALEGTFLTTGPPGSPPVFNYFNLDFSLAFTFENDISRASDTSPRCLIWHFLTWPCQGSVVRLCFMFSIKTVVCGDLGSESLKTDRLPSSVIFYCVRSQLSLGLLLHCLQIGCWV